MLGTKQQTRTDRVKDVLTEAIAFTDEVVRDQRLRANLRAAIDHGQQAGSRVRDDIEVNGITSRLASDKKLRKNVQALIDDLEAAGQRIRRRRTHRLRNAMLVLAGIGAAAALVPSARQWIAEQFGTDDVSSPDVVNI